MTTVVEILKEIEERISKAIENMDYGKADRIYRDEWIRASEAAENLYETRAE